MQWLKKLFKTRREKTPVILQIDHAECGAVALAMILGYFGRHIPASEARDACDVTRDGSKAINIIKAAREYHLEAHGMQLDLEQVQSLPPPFIVYWQFNHFLVVEGFTKNHVYLNDPATGPRIVTIEEFANSFTGVVLYFYPDEHFQTGGQAEISIFRSLWQQLSGVRGIFFYIILISIALSIFMLSLPFFAKIFIDNIWLQKQYDWLPEFLLSMTIVALFLGIFTWIKRRCGLWLYLKLYLDGTSRLFWRMLQLPIKFFQQRAPGDLADRIEAYGDLVHILSDKITHYIAVILTMVLLTIAIFLLSPLLAIINLTIAGMHFIVLWCISRRHADLAKRVAQARGKLLGMEVNGMQIIETIKANTMERQFFDQWAGVQAQKINSEQHIAINKALLSFFPLFLQGLNMLMALGVGSWLIMHDLLSPGSLVAILMLFLSFNFLLQKTLMVNEYLGQFSGDIARIADIDQQAPEAILDVADSSSSLPAATGQPILALRNIVFGYSRLEPPIFSGISLQVKAGDSIAIVGLTGGGKSSIAKLICGLYPLWSGEITVQGVALSTMSRAALARFIGLVDQQIFLFAATLRDNLTLWNPQVADQDIYEALKIVQVADVVKERGGLDSWVEERGKNFSGGQVQRLEIARALIAKPQLLILDEATAALDSLSEQKIYANLHQQRCTLIIIAHRLSAIRDCNQIIVIDQGKIVQSGTHQELIASNGLYRELVSLEIQ